MLISELNFFFFFKYCAGTGFDLYVLLAHCYQDFAIAWYHKNQCYKVSVLIPRCALF